ncbi:MAG: conjugal transfer protein TraG N-terminal domain-containing protein [Sulfuricaulis sp.]
MYEIFSYGNQDALVQVFNGIAALMGSGDYADLIRTVMLISLFAAVIGGLFAARFHGFNWFIGMTFFYMVLFIPKATVLITDRIQTGPSVPVANVPIGLAFFGHVTSSIGDYLTTSFEAVFSLPNDLQYQQHGVLFGNKLFNKTMSLEMPNADARNDFLTFVKDCTYRDIQDGTIDVETLNTSQDIWTTMSGTNPGRQVVLPSLGFPLSCNFVWSYLNTGSLPTQTADAKQRLGMDVNPQITNGVLAATMVDGQLVSTTQTLIGVANTADLTIQQAFMRNLISGGGVSLAQEIGDPAATQIALAQATAESTSDLTGKTLAKVAEQTLPMVRNTIEVIAYAVFPIVFLTCLLPFEAAITALKGYLYTLLWIQLWPPLYAVLNLVVTLEASRQMTAVSANGWGLSIASADGLIRGSVSAQSIAGYLTMAIPIVAMGLIKGMDSVATSMASGALQPIQGATGTAGQSVGTGNLSYGVVNHDNASWNNQSANKNMTAGVHENPLMMTEINPENTSVFGPGGFRSDTDRIPNLAVKPQLATSTATSHEQAALTQMSSAFSDVASFAQSHTKGTQSAFSWDTATNAADEKLSAVRSGIHDKLTHSFGKDFADRNTDTIMYGAGGSIGMGVPKALSEVTGLKGGLSADFKNQHTGQQSETAKKAFDIAQTEFNEHGITDSHKFAETFSQSSAYKQLHAQDAKLASSVDAKLSSAKTESETARTMEQLSHGASADLSMALQREFDARGVTARERIEHPEKYVGLANEVLERVAKQKVASQVNIPTRQFTEQELSANHTENAAHVFRNARTSGVVATPPSVQARDRAERGLSNENDSVSRDASVVDEHTKNLVPDSKGIEADVNGKVGDTEKYGTGLKGTLNQFRGKSREDNKK